jgi:hypothetical protein
VTALYIKRKNVKGIRNLTRKYNSSITEKLASLRGPTIKQIEVAISILKGMKEEERNEIIEELQAHWGGGNVPEKPAFLTWDEVKKMYGGGLVTFGSHTANHKILVNMDDQKIRDELIRSKKKLLEEKVVDSEFIPFCYPNGDHDKRVVQITKEAGYHLAVTTENNWNSKNTSVFNLRRIAIHQDMTFTKALFRCRIAGIL